MRLTLRTLLAYLDDNLEPADAATLGEKIAENPNANELTHRIRDCMTRPRLSSPPVEGKGVAADANSVSEYLDNTLPVEQMPDFERTCLESDVHLAEVAACHQILTMVVGEPAIVEETLRQRAYELQGDELQGDKLQGGGLQQKEVHSTHGGIHRRIDAGTSTATSSVVTSTTEDTAGPTPYYDAADSPRSYVWPIALILLAGFLITTALVNGWNWFRDSQVATGSSVATMPAENATPPVVVETIPPQPVERSVPLATETIETLDAQHSGAAAPSDAPDTIDPEPRRVATAPTPKAAPMVVAPPPLVPSKLDVEPTPPAPAAVPTPDQLASNEAPKADETRNAIGMTVGGKEFPVEPIASSDEDADSNEPEEEAEPQDVARSVVEDQVIAIWNAEKQAWTRLPLRAPLRVGQRFRNLPTFRPQLLLLGGLQMTLDGSADFSFGEPSGADTPRVNFSHGRGTFVGLGQAPSRVELDVAGRMITVQQGDPGSEFAVEVIRTRTPGSDPRTASRHHVVKIWSKSGRIGVADGEEKTRAVEAGQMWIGVDRRAAVIGDSGALPTWTAGAKMRNIDRDALLDLEPLLTEDRSLTLSLLEAAKNRRTDIRSLAARCLAALGRFEPLVESLGDQKQHAHWPEHVAQLRAAVDQHPESSALVTQALRRVTGPDADVLLESLRSYNPLQLADGGAEQLIDELENESIEVRVVAIEMLKHITGMSQLYRADRPAAQRQVAVQKWRGRLEEGEVLYAEQPLIFSGDEEK